MRNSFIIIRDLLYVITVFPMILYNMLAVFLGVKVVRPPIMKARQTFQEAELGGVPVTLIPASNIILDAWLIEQPTSDTIVVVTHELGACKESKIRLARVLIELGVSALYFDLRNHGRSTTDKSLRNRGDRYTDDIECALLQAGKLGYKKIVLYAASFSTFPALYVLDRSDKDIKINALVMDSGPVYDLSELVKRYLDEFGKKLLPVIFRGGISQIVIGKMMTAVTMFLFNVKWPSKDIRSIPKLFIVGGQDSIVTVTEVQKLQSLYSNSRLWVIPNAAHLRTLATSPEDYKQELKNFIDAA